MNNPNARRVKIDPHSDKLAFFKDNIRDEEDTFDPHMYYYNRKEIDQHDISRQQQQPAYPKKDMRRDENPQQAHHKQAYQQPPPQHLSQQPSQQQQQYQQVQYQQYQQHQNGPKNTTQRQHVPVSPQKQANQRSMMYNQSNTQQRGETKQILKEPLNDSTANLNLNSSGNITIQSNALNAPSGITIQSNATSVPSSRATSNAPVNLSHQPPSMNHNTFLNNSGTFVNTMANASNVFHTHSNVVPNSDLHSNVNMTSGSPPPTALSSFANHAPTGLSSLSNPSLTPNHLNLSNSNIGSVNLNSSNNSIHNSNQANNIALNNSASNISTGVGDPLQGSLGLDASGGVYASNSNPSARQQADGGNEHDQYDLLGLLKVLKMTNLNLNILAFGTDLTTLGLNLSSTDVLHTTFASPFSSTPLKQEPIHSIPDCYFINPPLTVPTDKMNLFSDETLFYIFYGMPNDVLQVAAAVELAARDWSYHTELRVWFQRLPGTTPLVKAINYETGSYIYFDIQQWKDKTKTNFQMEYEKLYSPKT